MRVLDPGLDIVVVNYRTPDDLESWVNSFLKHEPTYPYDLWIANVEPRDWDQRHGRFMHDLVPHATYVEFPTNVGYATAVNRCLEEGSRSVVLAMNADTRITPGVLDECYEKLLSRPDWGVLGPRSTDELLRITHAGIFGTHEQPQLRGWLQKDRGQFSELRDDAVSVSGSAYFCKRHVWQELTDCPIYQSVAEGAEGAFLPTTHYYEETACSYHAVAHGYKVVYDGEDHLVHIWHRASPVGGWAEQQMGASREFFRVFCDAHGIPHD